MKKTIALVICLVMMSVVAFASQTGDSTCLNIPGSPSLVNEWFRHGHNYSQTSKYKAPLGYGVDLTLYEMDIANVGVGIGIDGTYDQNNGVFGCMAKVRINTTQLINKLIGK